MNSLDLAVKNALDLSGNTHEANKVYLEFIKANFMIPVEKKSDTDNPEVLYLEDNGYCFLPVFSEMDHFNQWALDIKDKINVLKLSGVDLLKGIGDNITVCLNIGSPIYK